MDNGPEKPTDIDDDKRLSVMIRDAAKRGTPSFDELNALASIADGMEQMIIGGILALDHGNSLAALRLLESSIPYKDVQWLRSAVFKGLGAPDGP